MTYEEFIKALAQRWGTSQAKARRWAEIYKRLICIAVAAKGEVRIPKFGTFYRKTHEARRVFQPATGEQMNLPKFETLGFRAVRALRKEVQ